MANLILRIITRIRLNVFLAIELDKFALCKLRQALN
jgi:hypothetical protein